MSQPRVRTAAAVVLALVTGLLVWLLVRDGDGAGQRAPASAVLVNALRALPDGVGHPVYWVGEQQGVTYELTQTPEGRVYVRYLPDGVVAGSKTPVLTVGTYPLADAFAATEAAASQPASVRVDVGPGSVAFFTRDRPANVYLARRGSDLQVEVFDPVEGRARDLVASGRVSTVAPAATAAPPPTTAALVSAEGLRTLAAAVGRPVYWAGEKRGFDFEATQTPEGRFYVRCLPEGVAAGSDRLFLTVGTYQLADAFAVTQAAARRPGSVRLELPGGIAFYSRERPTSVYLAYPGSEYQIEVYDPSPGRARRLVTSGRVRPVA